MPNSKQCLLHQYENKLRDFTESKPKKRQATVLWHGFLRAFQTVIAKMIKGSCKCALNISSVLLSPPITSYQEEAPKLSFELCCESRGQGPYLLMPATFHELLDFRLHRKDKTQLSRVHCPDDLKESWIGGEKLATCIFQIQTLIICNRVILKDLNASNVWMLGL